MTAAMKPEYRRQITWQTSGLTLSRGEGTDGCRTSEDVRYRKQMLNNIADGIRHGTVLIGHRVWQGPKLRQANPSGESK